MGSEHRDTRGESTDWMIHIKWRADETPPDLTTPLVQSALEQACRKCYVLGATEPRGAGLTDGPRVEQWEADGVNSVGVRLRAPKRIEDIDALEAQQEQSKEEP